MTDERFEHGREAGATAASSPENEVGRSEDTVVRHEEELRVGTQSVDAGSVRLRKTTETERVDETLPRDIEHADIERAGPQEAESGEIETLPDGSVSVPVFEEELVVTKRLVVRERIIIRKRTVTEEVRVAEELRKERVEVEADRGVELGEPEGRLEDRL